MNMFAAATPIGSLSLLIYFLISYYQMPSADGLVRVARLGGLHPIQ